MLLIKKIYFFLYETIRRQTLSLIYKIQIYLRKQASIYRDRQHYTRRSIYKSSKILQI
jgi:hypothetical protein